MGVGAGVGVGVGTGVGSGVGVVVVVGLAGTVSSQTIGSGLDSVKYLSFIKRNIKKNIPTAMIASNMCDVLCESIKFIIY